MFRSGRVYPSTAKKKKKKEKRKEKKRKEKLERCSLSTAMKNTWALMEFSPARASAQKKKASIEGDGI
jgi:hypothetical protein